MEGWKKVEELGTGSFGSVFLACDSSQSIKVAVKTAHSDSQSSVLIKEGKFLRQLNGIPNIVRCFGNDISIEDNQAVYSLLLEYAEGGNLHELINDRFNKGQRIPETQIAHYASMSLKGLAQIHSQGIVHCDLKPANILVFLDCNGLNQLKIGDFGSARRISQNEEEIWVSDSDDGSGGTESLSRTTLLYASPESVASGLHETSTDIWSFGCVVAEMITGESIWDYEDEMDLINEILHGTIVDRLPQNFPDNGVDFLNRCLLRCPEERWSALELLDHPFIMDNLKIMSEIHNVDVLNRLEEKQKKNYSQINPFGMSEWVSTKHLFTPKWMIEALEKQDDDDEVEAPVKQDDGLLLLTKSNPRGFRKCISFILGRMKKCKSRISSKSV
ncbi:OLC1v1012090C1 [Oldenlandia corymbosa var. corymbosa]|uniref:OLC1v1012090C1 n=1 Tax=Oldenlandia corymbosa var. corymbosa TaxID=529605 RepID=A0AAV1DY64_OLDCO|nr:OLC1v1012090C1 [Oldenlandia corymbosa var. corymbosa]